MARNLSRLCFCMSQPTSRLSQASDVLSQGRKALSQNRPLSRSLEAVLCNAQPIDLQRVESSETGGRIRILSRQNASCFPSQRSLRSAGRGNLPAMPVPWWAAFPGDRGRRTAASSSARSPPEALGAAWVCLLLGKAPDRRRGPSVRLRTDARGGPSPARRAGKRWPREAGFEPADG